MVLRSLKSSSRDFLKDECGEALIDSSGCPVLQRQPTSTPIYCFLTEERPRRGILLSPLPARLLQRVRGTPSTNFDEKYSVLVCDKWASESQIPSDTHVFDADSIASTNVLLSIRLDRDYFTGTIEENLQMWREWIQNIPPEAKGMNIEAIYEGFSTMVLLSLPVTLWNLLQDNPAYSFVGFITSTNKVPALEQKYVPAVEIPETSPIETRAPAPTRPAASRKKRSFFWKLKVGTTPLPREFILYSIYCF